MESPADLDSLHEPVDFGMIMEEAEPDDGKDPEYVPRMRNLGKVQHRKFTGYDQRLPMVIYGFREETVHGTSADGVPHSLIVLRWEIQQRSARRRFKSATIRATFQTTHHKDSNSRGGIDAYYDPHVVAVAPNGTYSMLATPVTVSHNRSVEGGLEAGMNFAKGTAKVAYELSQSVEAMDQIVINGFERNEYSHSAAAEIGDPDRCNVAEWQLFENSAVKSGLPTLFRTAVLLERRNEDKCHFTCSFTIRAKIDDLTDTIITVKRFVGKLPRDDPIIFDPNVQEDGVLMEHKDKLDTVTLLDFCRFVMFKSELGPGKAPGEAETSHATGADENVG